MVAKGLTGIFLMCAKLCKVQISLSSVFTDFFTKDFVQYVQAKHQQSQSKNVQMELLVHTLPYLLSKITPLLPQDQHMSFKFVALLYYNMAVGIGNLNDIRLLKNAF